MTAQEQTILALLANVERANRKYGPLEDNCTALGALTLEYDEVKHEMQARNSSGVYRELIDTATVCVRRCTEIIEERKRAGYTMVKE